MTSPTCINRINLFGPGGSALVKPDQNSFGKEVLARLALDLLA
jgi:hypothetical protein